MAPNLNESTPFIFYMGLTHFGSEASILLKNNQEIVNGVCEKCLYLVSLVSKV